MKNHLFAVLVLAFVLVGTSARAEVLQEFSHVFRGDDPSQTFSYDLVFNPAVPAFLQLRGQLENLHETETGVRFVLNWQRADGLGWDAVTLPGEDLYPTGLRLPGSVATIPGRVTVDLSTTLEFTPAQLTLGIEGLGPDDYFSFNGELSIQPVPEPGTLAILGAAGLAFGILGWRKRR